MPLAVAPGVLQTALGGVADPVNMLYSQLLSAACCLSWAFGFKFDLDSVRRQTSDNLTNVVEWDQNSVFINGKRVLLYNAEFHAYRLPVPSLWLDIFQKLKAAGFSGVSYYTEYVLLFLRSFVD